jgi:long-subunit acyl-CoA synthetase (AMP-forming)
MSSVASLVADGKVDQNDVILSYLPLAHILAFTLETACFALGMSIGYGVHSLVLRIYTCLCVNHLLVEPQIACG